MRFIGGGGSSADQRRHRHDLVAARKLRMLHQVDHLDAIASGEVRFTNLSRLFSAAAERAVSPAV
jgi:hypothetical protein